MAARGSEEEPAIATRTPESEKQEPQGVGLESVLCCISRRQPEATVAVVGKPGHTGSCKAGCQPVDRAHRTLRAGRQYLEPQEINTVTDYSRCKSSVSTTEFSGLRVLSLE